MKFDEDNGDWECDFENTRQIQRNRIIVKNIPKDLTDEGLRNMCEPYGTITNLHWPPGHDFAFVSFETPADADKMLRCFCIDYPSEKMFVEYAKNRQMPLPQIDYTFDDIPALISDDQPIRNVLELNKRKIQGPFANPVDAYKVDSLLGTCYRNLMLISVDPTKEFLWNSNDEAHFECEFMNNHVIAHGRAIFKSNLKTNDVDVSNVGNSGQKLISFNAESIPKIQVCANCSRPADKYCKTCESPQCTLECHALNCARSMANDENVDPKRSNKTLMSSKIHAKKIDQIVKITAVINLRLLFVRPGTREDDIKWARFMCDTVTSAKDADTLTALPNVGSLVFAKFDYYQRALVLKHVNDTDVVVAFIDYGNVETRAFNELKIMPDHLKQKKRFATKIELSGIEHDIMNNKALKVLYRYMAYGTELNIKLGSKNETTNVVSATLKASDKWVNDLVNQMNVDAIERPSITTIADRTFYKELTPKFIDSKQMSGKEVIILDNSQIALGDLTFIDADDFKLFRENDRRIQNICNYLFSKPKCHTPMEAECCVVKCKDRWYRTYCVEICFDGFATMQFIDYGNVQLIEVNDIRPIPESLLFEVVTITADCFSDVDILEMPTEKLAELKKQHATMSRQKIERIEVHKDDKVQYFVWLQKTL